MMVTRHNCYTTYPLYIPFGDGFYREEIEPVIGPFVRVKITHLADTHPGCHSVQLECLGWSYFGGRKVDTN